MSYLCVLEQEGKDPTFQIESDAGRLVRLLTKDWAVWELDLVMGNPMIGNVVTLGPGTQVSSTLSHDVLADGETIGTGEIRVATDSE